MRIGMLWFDNDPTANLTTKVERAASYYTKKYGSPPSLVFVHPSMLNGDKQVGDIELRAHRSVLPNHLWVGIRDDLSQRKGG